MHPDTARAHALFELAQAASAEADAAAREDTPESHKRAAAARGVAAGLLRALALVLPEHRRLTRGTMVHAARRAYVAAGLDEHAHHLAAWALGTPLDRHDHQIILREYRRPLEVFAAVG